MNGFKTILRILVPVIAGLLCSCFDSREEFWLEADGSGHAKLSYHLPAAVAALHGGESGIRELVGGFINDTPEIKEAVYEVVSEDNRVRVKIDAAFDSAQAIEEIASGAALKGLPSAASHLAGEITTKLHGRTLEFSRRIDAAKVLPGSAFLSEAQLEGHRMTYIMHLPAVPAESNATRVEDAGRTLVWDIPLSQAVKAPVVTRFKMTVPIPWRFLPVIGIPLSLAACGWVLLRIRKTRHDFPGGNPRKPVL